SARAHCQLKYVVGTKVDDIIPALRRHLDRHGFHQVDARLGRGSFFNASRLDPADPWVDWTKKSLTRTAGRAPTVLPNFGGSLPSDIFGDVLKLKPSGFRTLILAVHSTRPTSTCWRRS